MFHYPAVKWTRLQAEALAIPQLIVPTEGLKEKELGDLKGAIERAKAQYGLDGIISGAVASEYQRTRIDYVCEKLSLRSFAPLWHKNQRNLVAEQIDFGLEIIVTACNAMGLDAKWLGRKLGRAELSELVKLSRRMGLNVAFEGGEAETFVLYAPNFRNRLTLTKSKPVWKGDSGYLEIEEMEAA